MKGWWLVAVALTGVLIQALAVLQTNGGFIHPECPAYHIHLLSPDPLPKKLFDPRVLDQGNYQARELSYLVDWLDYRFIDFTIRKGHCYYISPSSVLCFFAVGLLVWSYYASDLRAPPAVAYGAALLFWTSPPIFLGLVRFRSSKPCVMLALAVSLVLTLRLARRRVCGGRYAALLAALFLSVNAMGLFDRQGYFAVCGLFLVSVFMIAAEGKREWAQVAAVCLVAILLNNLYNYVVAPEVIRRLNGYDPSFEYQSNSYLLKTLISSPHFLLAAFFGAMAPLRCLVWDLPPAVCLTVVPFLWYRMGARGPASDGAERWPGNLTLLVAGLVYIMYAMMIVRLPQIFAFYDVYRSLYNGPAIVLLLLLLPLSWGRLGINLSGQSNQRPGLLLIGLLVLNNLLGCCEFRYHVNNGHLAATIRDTKAVIRELNALYSTGARSADERILTHPIYQFYLHRHDPSPPRFVTGRRSVPLPWPPRGGRPGFLRDEFSEMKSPAASGG